MKEVLVTECNLSPEMAKEYRTFEHEGRRILLGEASVTGFEVRSGFRADIYDMHWITESGDCTEMTVDEKKEIIREIKKWNKREKCKGMEKVRFADTAKGIYALSPKQQNMLGFVGAGVILAWMCMVWIVLPLLSHFHLL